MFDSKLIVEKAWKELDNIDDFNKIELLEVLEHVLDLCDIGSIRVSEKVNGDWIVNEWVKKAVLLYFRIKNPEVFDFRFSESDTGKSCWFDKIDLKFSNWNSDKFKKFKIRSVPGSFVRRSSYIGQNVVIMPSFINMCAYVDDGTMIDSWVTVGSGAQIGKNCHISGGVGIGGVLEPLQSRPVIIEDNCFIGARSEVAEGVIIREGAVLAMGVYIGASTKIIDRVTGDIYKGEVPEWSVVVPGSYSSSSNSSGTISLYCAVIVKKVDQQTRSKTSINDILRNI